MASNAGSQQPQEGAAGGPGVPAPALPGGPHAAQAGGARCGAGRGGAGGATGGRGLQRQRGRTGGRRQEGRPSVPAGAFWRAARKGFAKAQPSTGREARTPRSARAEPHPAAVCSTCAGPLRRPLVVRALREAPKKPAPPPQQQQQEPPQHQVRRLSGRALRFPSFFITPVLLPRCTKYSSRASSVVHHLPAALSTPSFHPMTYPAASAPRRPAVQRQAQRQRQAAAAPLAAEGISR